MSARPLPPFRADHVGSLLRPPELLRARADFKSGRIDADALREAEDEAILGVIELQREVGLQSVTDGEFRRTSWHMDFIYSLEGIDQVAGETLHVQFRNEDGEYDYAPPAMRVGGKVGCPRDDLRRRLHLPARPRSSRADAEADDPVAEHGPLPRRQFVDRRVGLSGHRRTSGWT